MNKRQRRVGPRIFLQLFALLAGVFACVFLAFNLYFKNYVETNARTQLDAIQTGIRQNVGPDGDGETPGKLRVPDLTRLLGNTVRSQATVFNLDAAYTLTDWDENDDPDEIRAIAAALRQAGASLTGTACKYLRTDKAPYYVTSIADPVLADTYMVFALDATAMFALWRSVNIALACIMAAAMGLGLVVAAALTRTVTEPLSKLSAFAEQLGRGDFTRRELHFRDAEFTALAAAMDRSAEKLDAADREQRTFFQNVSHELRTPLMSIRCYAEGISCGVMEPGPSGAVILSEVDRLSELVEDLLYISRMDRTSASEKVQEGDLRETVSLCATALRPLAEKNGIAFRFAFDETPVCFTYNENHLYRAVNNLVSNALRYARSEVVLGCVSEDGAAVISVQDDGAGIAPDDLPHVFERFYKGPGGKAGIGLAIVRAVAELYGGSVRAENAPGARFVLRFPLKNEGAPGTTAGDLRKN